MVTTTPEFDFHQARVLCELSTLPHRLPELSDDLGMTRGQVRAEIVAAKRDGWPITGNPTSGYRLKFDETPTHRRLRGELETIGNHLYG